MHSDHDAFIRIILHKFVFQFTTAELPDFDATRADDSYVKMHTNAHTCIKMRRNAYKCAGLVDHTYIHKRRRVDSRLDSHGSMQHGPDGLRTGCDRVPM